MTLWGQSWGVRISGGADVPQQLSEQPWFSCEFASQNIFSQHLSVSITSSFWGLRSMGSRILSFDVEVELFLWFLSGEGNPLLDAEFPCEIGP